MSKNPMASAVALCGVGLCLIGGAMFVQGGGTAQAGASLPTGVANALVASAVAQGTEPTVVWYGVSPVAGYYGTGLLLRAWSDGSVEGLVIQNGQYGGQYPCDLRPDYCSGWIVISSPTQGTMAASDVDRNGQVDGADLGTVLGNWGATPQNPFPPSDCPLNLINP